MAAAGCWRMLAMVAQARTDLADARPVQQADGRVAQQGHDGGPLATMDQAGILAQGDIRDAVQSILNPPMPAFALQETLGRPDSGRETGAAVAHHLFARAVLRGPCSHQLRRTRKTGATPGQSR